MGTKETTLASIQQRIEYKILTTKFKTITGMAPKYLQDPTSIKQTHMTICALTTLAPYYTHEKSSAKPLQHGPSGITHQHCGISYQRS